MRDDQTRAARHQFLQRSLHQFFGLRIEGRSRFVEDQNRRIFQKSAGDCQPLPLAAAEFRASVADVGFEFLRQIFDELEGVCGFGCRSNLLKTDIFRAKTDVFEDRVIKKNGLLSHDAHQRAEAF